MKKEMLLVNRVKQIMKEENLDIKNEMLVLNMSIIYVKAQADLLRQQLEERNESNKN